MKTLDNASLCLKYKKTEMGVRLHIDGDALKLVKNAAERK